MAALIAKRADLLRTLADGPLGQRDLRDELGVSRSTVYKALRELTDEGLVVEGRGNYALTTSGRLLWRRHDDYRARLRRLDDARPLLESLPEEEAFPLALFERGAVALSKPHAPEEPLRRMEAIDPESDVLRCVSPVAVPRYLPQLRADLRDGTYDRVELVLVDDALDHLAATAEGFSETRGDDRCTLYSLSEALSFGLLLFEDELAALFGYNGGVVRGMAVSSAPEAVVWAERVYATYRAAAKPIGDGNA